MLIRKTQEPLAAVSKDTRPFLLDCSVQQLADDEFVAVLSKHDSGVEVCAWSGSADGVVVEFETWLDKKHPRPTRASV